MGYNMRNLVSVWLPCQQSVVAIGLNGFFRSGLVCCTDYRELTECKAQQSQFSGLR